MKNLLFIFLSLLVHSGFANTPFTCVLQGKVVDRDSKELILVKLTEDERVSMQTIQINEDHTFSYTLKGDQIERYNLTFKEEWLGGNWHYIPFFPDADTVKFELYPEERYDENIIIGGEINEEAQTYKKKLMSIYDPTFNRISNQMDSLYEIDQQNSEFAKQLKSESDSVRISYVYWSLDYIQNNPSLFSYSEFIESLNYKRYRNIKAEEVLEAYDILKEKFPDHLYTSVAQNIIGGLVQVKVGGSFVDFEAPDAEGNLVKISEIIKNNKFTLIDLWAPWCGPCIKKAKAIKPNYQELNKAGLTVIGVVGGISEKSEYTEAVNKYEYPWQNLVELNEENKVWEKYNIKFAGGSQFLVNQKGEILAINPDLAELQNIIESL
ncbi:redoxin domain-containing protein [Chondrinema litorale]|uniref:redoxin domain-containing protein n=1 Tax=Chondrinema litorale TaxID=2994555 RepID=UPI00254284DF|nr:redoxin domain-containing protein [Chondrinema litorale]UZR99766.1 redoxin domain-containing protein [Chondrinema litorale]